MSGHSHSKKIAHAKAATDAQRSDVFSKLAKEISLASRDGTDPAINSRLRVAMERARSFNMPKDNVERAVKRGTGEGGQNVQLEEMLLEAYGPGGIAILISVITDNKNRTLSEIKQILASHQGKPVEGGAVRWMFEQKGEIVINAKIQNPNFKKEDLELLVIEAGAQDLYWEDEDSLSLYTTPGDIEKMRAALSQKGVVVESSGLSWIPKERISLPATKETVEKLFEALDEQEDVQDVYSNIKL